MKIVIDLPDSDYQVMLTQIMLSCRGCKITELPKGHDRLIEAKRLKEVFLRNTGYDCRDLIDIAPTIIEADNAESE
jgi:hypothetical protein